MIIYKYQSLYLFFGVFCFKKFSRLALERLPSQSTMRNCKIVLGPCDLEPARTIISSVKLYQVDFLKISVYKLSALSQTDIFTSGIVLVHRPLYHFSDIP